MLKRKCLRVVATAKIKSGHSFAYQCPASIGDRKREGRTLVVSDGKTSMTFDGKGIKALTTLLKNVGECGKKASLKSRRVRLTVINP
jgi:hypothetical protein